MAITRITKETLYVRREFTTEQRLTMGSELAQAHNRMADIEDEEAVMKSQIKERKSGVELTINSLSRNLANGFTMENVLCALTYDVPNVNEVTYTDSDGAVVKVRPMTVAEQQMELPLEQPIVVVPPEKSADNIAEFFGKQDATAQDQPEPFAPLAEDFFAIPPIQEAPVPFEATSDDLPEVLASPDLFTEEFVDEHGTVIPDPRKKSGPADLKAFHAAEVEKEAKKAPRKPKGFDKPTNESAW